MSIARTTQPRSVYAAKLAEFPGVATVDQEAFARRGRWRDHFRDRIGPAFDGRVVFEVGCNDAGFLTRVAAKHSTTAFVGLDWKCKAIYDAANRVTKLGLRNVSLVRGRAQDIARIFGVGEVDEVWVFHPDPCDKPAELPNRLIAEPFLIDVHGVLRDRTSTLTLKTDHAGYYQWMLALLGLPEPEHFLVARTSAPGTPRVRTRDLARAENLPNASDAALRLYDPVSRSDDLWNDPAALARVAARPFAGERTAFEERFVAKRMPIYFVELRKR